MGEKDAATREQDDSPELTERDFARAISFNDVLAREAQRLQTLEGGPVRPTIGLALNADLVSRVRASGPDYDARVEAVLNEALADGRI
ncbi:MAG: BrnA antitoxin family protein [Janthinobacterium lividum]